VRDVLFSVTVWITESPWGWPSTKARPILFLLPVSAGKASGEARSAFERESEAYSNITAAPCEYFYQTG